MVSNMSEDLVTIEVNGVSIEAPKGAMLIDVTDANNITIPRFCYHKKLSVAANCRMCLVEVERAPKPLPACATPVNDGMKVFTQSPKALAAQKGTMEFLLINHPLDCPICDQGGECELQDVAMGYGEDVSRYTEGKRVVREKEIGPLIATDMTRCIHCTRCVRFGEEVAGLRELGATGRGEFVEIGTYVEKTVASEMSGNVIDLCPVGALTAKPSRYRARPWELDQHASIAAHDSMGSNIYMHTLRDEVVRVVPRENEAINETWLSDRDRFSYEGLNADDRLKSPMIKVDGEWQEADWETALTYVAEKLQGQLPYNVGALAGAQSTLEELYLFQKLMRGLGVEHIDHRLGQVDFSDQDKAPLFPWLGMAIQDLSTLDAAFIVASNVRKEQPIAAHRLRMASLDGCVIDVLNPADYDFRFDVEQQIIAASQAMLNELAGVAKACLTAKSADIPSYLADISVTAEQKAIADHLIKAEKGALILGEIANASADFSQLRSLAALIAQTADVSLSYLPKAANTVGAWLAGVVPHRQVAGMTCDEAGLDAQAMLAKPREAYVLLNTEIERDAADAKQAIAAMQAAKFVVSLSSYANDDSQSYADVLLPIGTFTETSGTFVNAEGRWQSFKGVTSLVGEARPGWKVLRVLGNLLNVPGFEQVSSEQVRDELKRSLLNVAEFSNDYVLPESLDLASSAEISRVSTQPMYAIDAIVRRAASLQQTSDALAAGVYMSSSQIDALGLSGKSEVSLRQGEDAITLPLFADDSLADGCAWVPGGVDGVSQLGSAASGIELATV